MEFDPNLLKPLIDDLRELIAVQKQAAQAAADHSREQIERSRANDARYHESHELQMNMQRTMLDRSKAFESRAGVHVHDTTFKFRTMNFYSGLTAGVLVAAAVIAMAWFIRHW